MKYGILTGLLQALIVSEPAAVMNKGEGELPPLFGHAELQVFDKGSLGVCPANLTNLCATSHLHIDQSILGALVVRLVEL